MKVMRGPLRTGEGWLRPSNECFLKNLSSGISGYSLERSSFDLEGILRISET